MAEVVLSTLAATAIGGALVGVGKVLFGWGSSAKDQTIAVLKSENERLLRERDALGGKLDVANRELIQAAGVTARIREDKNVPNDFAEDMPTGVRNLADLVSPKTKSLPPGVRETLTTYTSDMTITPRSALSKGG